MELNSDLIIGGSIILDKTNTSTLFEKISFSNLDNRRVSNIYVEDKLVDIDYNYNENETCIIKSQMKTITHIQPNQEVSFLDTPSVPKDIKEIITIYKTMEYIPLSLMNNPLNLSIKELSKYWETAHYIWLDQVYKRKPSKKGINTIPSTKNTKIHVDDSSSDEEYTHIIDATPIPKNKNKKLCDIPSPPSILNEKEKPSSSPTITTTTGNRIRSRRGRLLFTEENKRYLIPTISKYSRYLTTK